MWRLNWSLGCPLESVTAEDRPFKALYGAVKCSIEKASLGAGGSLGVRKGQMPSLGNNKGPSFGLNSPYVAIVMRGHVIL